MASKPCEICEDPEMFEDAGLCVDHYWEDDAQRKKERREKQGMLLESNPEAMAQHLAHLKEVLIDIPGRAQEEMKADVKVEVERPFKMKSRGWLRNQSREAEDAIYDMRKSVRRGTMNEEFGEGQMKNAWGFVDKIDEEYRLRNEEGVYNYDGWCDFEEDNDYDEWKCRCERCDKGDEEFYKWNDWKRCTKCSAPEMMKDFGLCSEHYHEEQFKEEMEEERKQKIET